MYRLELPGQVQGTVLDSETNEPIPYANIGIPKKNHGTVSDLNGKFELTITEKHLNDSIRISSIGYKPRSILAQDLLQSTTVFLPPQIMELKEVLVTSKKLKERVIGNTTKSKSLRGGFKNASLGHELGIFFNNGKKSTLIKSFQTNIVSNTDQDMRFRLNFYNADGGMPHEKIVAQNIIFSIDNPGGMFSLDLSSYNIMIQEDFFCTLELVENQDPGDVIFFSAGLLGNKLIYRETSHANWEKIGILGIGFNLTVER